MVNKEKILQKHFTAAASWRAAIKNGSVPNQKEINRLAEEWREVKSHIAPSEKEELLGLVDREGKPNSLFAPRWLCHFLGLRHPTVHLLLKWESPKLGPVNILQIRSWGKKDYPGHLDISVGGHVALAFVLDPLAVAYQEMEEELGLQSQDLVDHQLTYLFSYENESENPALHFYNSELNVVFTGILKARSMEVIHFKDKEVAGLYLCPEAEMAGLFKQRVLPVASALGSYLRYLFTNS